MSHPTLLVRRDPLLLPRASEIAMFLSDDVWAPVLSSAPGPQMRLRSVIKAKESGICAFLLRRDTQHYWEPLVEEWFAWIAGIELEFRQAVPIFVHYVVCRYNNLEGVGHDKLDSEAYVYLKKQLKEFWQVKNPDPKVGWFRDVLPTALDHGDEEYGHISLDIDVVDDGIIPPSPPRERKWDRIIGSRTYLEVCHEWNAHLNAFFFEADVRSSTAQSLVDAILPCRAACLTAITHMRAVPRRVCSSEPWRQAVSISNLAETMLKIATPGAVYRLATPIMETRNIGLWRDLLGEQLHSWTPKSEFLSPVEAPAPPKVYPAETPSGKTFVRYLNERPSMVPNVGNCFALFFLQSKDTFIHAWEEWLCAGLETHGHQSASRWDPERLFHNVKRYLCDKNTDLNDVDPTLRRIFENTIEHSRVLNQYRQGHFHQVFAHKNYKPPSKWTQTALPPVSRGLYAPVKPKSQAKPSSSSQAFGTISISRPTVASGAPSSASSPRREPKHPSMTAGVCPKCFHLPEKDCCIRVVYVQEYSDAQSLDGCVLTFATGRDRIAPLDVPALREQNTSYLSPDELGFTRYTHRSDVYSRCGRDCTVFIDKDTNENIGGVVYEAFPEHILKAMLESHAHVTLNNSCKRGNKFRAHATGKMVPIGARIPQGGAVGDGYGPYAHMSAATNEAIDGLMKHALDGNLLLTSVEPFNKHIVPELKDITKSAGITSFASAGINLYYCTNYKAPVHPDKDIGVSLCSQLSKTGHKPREGDFAYASHGFYIETRSNCTWWFGSERLHAPVMPSASTIDSGSSSIGNHSTIRKKDYNKATHYRNVRREMPTCRRYWETCPTA